MRLHHLFEMSQDENRRDKRKTETTKSGETAELYTVRGAPDEVRFPDYTGKVLYVVAKIDGNLAGSADFYHDGRSGSVEEVKVEPEYRRQGIATMMYDYLEELGYRVEPTSGRMEPDGAAFWRSRNARRRVDSNRNACKVTNERMSRGSSTISGSPLEEDSSDDLSMYREASRIRTALLAFFMHGQKNQHWGLRMRYLGGGKLSATVASYQLDLKGDDFNLTFSFTNVPLKGDARGSFSRKGSDCVIRLKVESDPGDHPALAREIIHGRGLHEVLLHEIIHYLDSKRDPTIMKRASSSSIGYYNRPEELNAFYHNLAEPLNSFITMAAQASPQSVERIANAKGISVDFSESLSHLLNAAKRNGSLARFIGLVNKRNWKSVLRRLYSLHQEALAVLSSTATQPVGND